MMREFSEHLFFQRKANKVSGAESGVVGMPVAESCLKPHTSRRSSHMYKFPNSDGTEPSFHIHWKHNVCFPWMARKSAQFFMVPYVLTYFGLFLSNKIHLLFVTLQEQNWTLWRFDLLSDFMEKLWANHHVI